MTVSPASGSSSNSRAHWIQYLTHRGVTQAEAEKIADTIQSGEVHFQNGEIVEEGGVTVSLSDNALDTAEAAAIGIAGTTSTDTALQHGWALSDESGYQGEGVVGADKVETTEVDRMFTDIEAYARAHKISVDISEDLYFKNGVVISRQDAAAIEASRIASHTALVGQYAEWSSDDVNEGGFVGWLCETYSIPETDPVIVNLEAYIADHAEPPLTNEQLVDYLINLAFFSRFDEATQTGTCKLKQAILGRPDVRDYTLAALEAFMRNESPAGTEEGSAVAEEGATPPSSEDTNPAEEAESVGAAPQEPAPDDMVFTEAGAFLLTYPGPEEYQGSYDKLAAIFAGRPDLVLTINAAGHTWRISWDAANNRILASYEDSIGSGFVSGEDDICALFRTAFGPDIEHGGHYVLFDVLKYILNRLNSGWEPTGSPNLSAMYVSHYQGNSVAPRYSLFGLNIPPELAEQVSIPSGSQSVAAEAPAVAAQPPQTQIPPPPAPTAQPAPVSGFALPPLPSYIVLPPTSTDSFFYTEAEKAGSLLLQAREQEAVGYFQAALDLYREAYQLMPVNTQSFIYVVDQIARLEAALEATPTQAAPTPTLTPPVAEAAPIQTPAMSNAVRGVYTKILALFEHYPFFIVLTDGYKIYMNNGTFVVETLSGEEATVDQALAGINLGEAKSILGLLDQSERLDGVSSINLAELIGDVGTPATLAKVEEKVAHQLYESAVTFFEAQEYQVALNYFDQAYHVLPNASTAVSMAICYEKLGKLDEARELVARLHNEYPDYTSELLAELEGRLNPQPQPIPDTQIANHQEPPAAPSASPASAAPQVGAQPPEPQPETSGYSYYANIGAPQVGSLGGSTNPPSVYVPPRPEDLPTEPREIITLRPTGPTLSGQAGATAEQLMADLKAKIDSLLSDRFQLGNGQHVTIRAAIHYGADFGPGSTEAQMGYVRGQVTFEVVSTGSPQVSQSKLDEIAAVLNGARVVLSGVPDQIFVPSDGFGQSSQYNCVYIW